MEKKISTLYSFTLPENEKELSNNELMLLRKNYLAAKDFHGYLLKSKFPKSPESTIKIKDNVPFKKYTNTSESNLLRIDSCKQKVNTHVSPKSFIQKCLTNDYSPKNFNNMKNNPYCFSCANLFKPIKTNKDNKFSNLDFEMSYFKNKNKELVKQNEDLEDFINHDNPLRVEISDLRKKYERLDNEIKSINKKKIIQKTIKYNGENLIKKNKKLEKKNKYYLNIIKINEKFIKELESNNQDMERLSKLGEDLKKESLKALDFEKKIDTTLEEEIEVDEIIELRRTNKKENNNNIKKKRINGNNNNINKKIDNNNNNKKRNNAIKKEKEDIIKKYEDFCKEYSKKNEELNNKITQLSIENNKLTVEQKEKEYKISELESRNEQLQKKISELINENNLLEKKYSELFSLKMMESIEKNLSIQDLNENINSLKIENMKKLNEQKDKIRRLNDKIEDLENEVEKKEEEIQQSMTIGRNNKQIEELLKNIKQNEENFKKLKEEMNNKTNFEQVKKEVGDERKLNELEEILNRNEENSNKIKEQIEDLIKKISDLEKNNQNLNDQLREKEIIINNLRNL